MERHRLTGDELFHLMGLVGQAWEAEGDARRAALEELVAWFEDVPFMRARRELWRRRARQDALIQLLCDTDPDRLKGGGRDDRAA